MIAHRLPMRVQPSGPATAMRLLLLVLVLVLGSLVAGAGVAVVGAPFVAMAAGAVLGGFALFVPLPWLLWVMIATTFVVVGAAQYFGGVNKAFWAPYLLGALLWLRVPMARYHSPMGKTVPTRHAGLPTDAVIFAIMAGLFFTIALASTLFNLAPWVQVVISAKEYLFLWSICVLVAAGHTGIGFERRVWLAILWLAPLQVPVVLYQRFVVAVGRHGSSAWDSVVGLFGGDPEGGGASAAMAFFVMFCALLALSLWQSRQLRLRHAVAVVVSALLCIVFAEVKAVILLMPLAIAMMFRRDLLRRPLRAMAFVGGAVGLSVALVMVYQAQFSNTRTKAGHSVEAYVELMFDRAADADYFEAGRAKMNRTTALVYWWAQHEVTDPVRFFLGDGIGATRVGSLAVGETARQHRYRLNTTAASQLLWETGLLGLLAAVGLLMAGMQMAGRASRDAGLSPYQRAVAAAAQPTLLITVIGVAYNTDFIGTPPAQLLAMLLLGYMYRLRRLGAHQAAAVDHGKR